jgi:hypothetical protein
MIMIIMTITITTTTDELDPTGLSRFGNRHLCGERAMKGRASFGPGNIGGERRTVMPEAKSRAPRASTGNTSSVCAFARQT